MLRAPTLQHSTRDPRALTRRRVAHPPLEDSLLVVAYDKQRWARRAHPPVPLRLLVPLAVAVSALRVRGVGERSSMLPQPLDNTQLHGRQVLELIHHDVIEALGNVTRGARMLLPVHTIVAWNLWTAQARSSAMIVVLTAARAAA